MNAETGAEVARLPGFHFGINNIVFSPDGKLLAGTDGDHRILIWDLTTRKLIHPFQHEEGFVTAIAYAPDGKTIAVAADNVIPLARDYDRQTDCTVDGARRACRVFGLFAGRQAVA